MKENNTASRGTIIAILKLKTQTKKRVFNGEGFPAVAGLPVVVQLAKRRHFAQLQAKKKKKPKNPAPPAFLQVVRSQPKRCHFGRLQAIQTRIQLC